MTMKWISVRQQLPELETLIYVKCELRDYGIKSASNKDSMANIVAKRVLKEKKLTIKRKTRRDYLWVDQNGYKLIDQNVIFWSYA